jgi:hypothetical protein
MKSLYLTINWTVFPDLYRILIGKLTGKAAHGTPRKGCENMTDLQNNECEVSTGFIWLRLGTIGILIGTH